MAPKNVSRKQTEHHIFGAEAECEQETWDPKAVSEEMEKNTHARKTQKRNQLSAKYEQEMASLGQQILSVAEAATKLLADIRQDQLQRLQELVRRRCEVEDQIVQHGQVLDKAYDAANKETKAAARGRLEDLQSNEENNEELESQAEGGGRGGDPGKEAVKNARKIARNCIEGVGS